MSIDLGKHTAEVNELWSAFSRRENHRVPVWFASDEQFWLKHSGKTFREFYTNPETHLNVQLEAKSWAANHVFGDTIPGAPERWSVATQIWMEENEFYGAEVAYQEDDYAWAKPIPLGKEDLLKHIAELDPDVQVRKNSAFKMYNALKELSAGKTFQDRPVDIAAPGVITHGIFTKAAELRGLEQLCMDICEDPDWVDKYLTTFTDKTIARIQAYHKLIHGMELQLPMDDGYRIYDDSMQMISAEVYERFVLPHHRKLLSTLAKGERSIHLCGHSSQHYEILHDKLGIRSIDGPGVFVDHGKYLHEFGPEFSFVAQTDHTVLGSGTKQAVADMALKLLRPGAKIPGRFQIMGFIHKETRLANIELFYQLAKEHGRIEKT